MELKTAALKLNDADKAVREAALAAIAQARAGAVGPLAEALEVPGAPVGSIALTLAALKGRAGVRALGRLVNRGVVDVETRAVVARALAELIEARDATDVDVCRAVLSLSHDALAATRLLIVPALRALADPASEARLEDMARVDADLPTRAAAAQALAALRAARPSSSPSRAVPAALGGTPMEEGGLHVDLEALVSAQASSSPQASLSSSSLAAPAGPHAALVVRLRDARWSVRAAAVEDVLAQATTARASMVAMLLDVLGDVHVGARIGAAQALARLQAPEAATALLEVVTKTGVGSGATPDEKELRPIALKALASTLTGAEEGYAPALLPLVKDADPFVRAGALLCLGRLADRAGARAAVLGLGDAHEHVREAAAVALSEGVREDDVDLVLPLLSRLGAFPSPSVAAREAILLALARIQVDDAALAVRVRHRVRREVLGITSSLRRTAIAILERSHGPHDPPSLQLLDDVLSRLRDEHPEVRLLAASFLSLHLVAGMTGAAGALEEALRRNERALSLVALEALRRHDTEAARRALESASVGGDIEVAARAASLLEGFTPRTEEWRSAARPPRPTAPPAMGGASPGAAPPGGMASTGTAPESSSGRPRRVRPARGASSDVVEAKDPDAPSSPQAAQDPQAREGPVGTGG